MMLSRVGDAKASDPRQQSAFGAGALMNSEVGPGQAPQACLALEISAIIKASQDATAT